MLTARGIRAVVVGAFVIGAAGVGVGMASAGARPAPAPPDGDGGAIQCEAPPDQGDTAPTQDGRVTDCAQLEVTKVVTGTPAPSPPPGTNFAVVVDCVPTEGDGMGGPAGGAGAQQLPQGQTPPFTTTLTFPADGGTQSVFVDRRSECTVSETPPAACTLRSIDPVTTQIEEPILYQVRVTNNCDPQVTPTSSAAPAPVVAGPRFTG